MVNIRWGMVLCFVVSSLSFIYPACATTIKLTGTATNITLNISDPDAGYTNLNAIIDPYTGTLNGSSILLWCVDPDHESNIGDSWSAYVTQLGAGSLSDTYLKDPTAYGEMAWLTMQLQGTNVTSTRQELQAAIWDIAEGATAGAPTATGDFKITPPKGDANFAANVSMDITNASHHVQNSGFEILTDTSGREQEFLVITPEPSTFVLFGAGLIALALFTNRRIISSISCFRLGQ